MSDSLGARDPRLYVEDMLEFCERAVAYASDLDLEGLLRDQMRYDAILRNLELIGESSTHIPAEHRALTPEVPWREILGTRNRIAHAYLGISPKVVWSILQDELPTLRDQLRRLRDLIPPSG